MVVLRGRIVQPERNGFRHEYDPILRHHYYSNFHMTDVNMKLYLKHIRTIGPCMFHAFPSSAQAFARFIIGMGEQVPQNIIGVLLESENVYSDQVDDIEKAFGARAFSAYGHGEKCVFAAQCEHTANYHVWPTYGYFELVDEQGTPLTLTGQEGEIVGTGFINTVIPFIRYRTGDRAIYVSDHCEECGREHVTIRDINGRGRQDGLIAADGSAVPIIGLYPHDDTFRYVREYQFHQSVPGKAILCVVPIAPIDEMEQRRIITNMNKRLQGLVKLILEMRSELAKTARGKQLRVIQKCRSSTEQE